MSHRPRTSTSCLAVAATLTSLLGPTVARAESISASDCNLGFTNTYNKGDAVCVTGEFDHIPPNKIWAESYVYVVPVTSVNPFADVTGAPNYVIGNLGGGSFIDEYVWLPPLKSGQYEFVIDNYPFNKDQGAPFEPGLDNRTGEIFNVSSAPTVFSVDPTAIKAAAAKGLLEAAALNLLAQTLSAIDTVSTVVDWWITFGGLGGLAGGALGVYCTYAMKDCPTSYNSAVLTIANKILGGMADSLWKKYDAIILDPPDPNFKAPVGLDFAEVRALGWPWTPGAEQELPRGQIALANLIALQSMAYLALVPSMEKVQGAKQAGDNLWQLLHAEKVEAYAGLALAAGDRMLQEVDALEAYLAGKDALGVGLPAAEFNASVAAVKDAGFSDDERNYLRSFGLSEADIDMTQTLVAAQAEVPDDLTMASVLARTRASFEELRPALEDLVAQAAAVRTENEEGTFRPGPKLTIAAAPAAKVGEPVMLSASAAHFDPMAQLSYAWDLDLDGDFDDGDAAAVAYTPTAPGLMLVAAQVSDGADVDLAFVTVEVTVSNSPPEITNATPVDAAPFADVGEAVELHIDPVDADDDPLTITWTVDGQAAGEGPDLVFMMPDEQAHTITVTVADDDPYSPDARMTRVIRAGKWEGMVPDPTTDTDSTSDSDTSAGTEGTGDSGADPTGDEPTGGQPTGGGPTGGPGPTAPGGTDTDDTAGGDTAMAGGGEGGCGCDQRGGAPLSLLALALVAWPRRRRRAS
jgi:hypothetical protein